jgi:hypothetical protein
MSVVGRIFDWTREVNLMISTRVLYRPAPAPAVPRARPGSVDRVVNRLGVAMLRWARRRAARPAVSFEDRVRLTQNARARELRERGYTVSAPRIW